MHGILIRVPADQIYQFMTMRDIQNEAADEMSRQECDVHLDIQRSQ